MPYKAVKANSIEIGDVKISNAKNLKHIFLKHCDQCERQISNSFVQINYSQLPIGDEGRLIKYKQVGKETFMENLRTFTVVNTLCPLTEIRTAI